MKKILLIVSILVPMLVFPQEFNYVFEPDSIPVEIQDWNPFCPFSGGMSRSVPEMVDLDDDSDLDMFAGNYFSYKYFENIGNITEPDFTIIPEMTNYLEEDGVNAVAMCDINDDGDYDLFVESDEQIWYFENIGTPQEALFELITDSLEQIIWWAGNPDLVDIDTDGDYDLFTGRGSGILCFYRNDGTPLMFNFTPVAENFENIDVGDYSDPCFIDIDNDNDYDLFIGAENGKICYYRNVGDSVDYDFTYVTDNYAGIDVGSYSSPEFADIDNDGDYDLFVGSGGRTYYYENIGTPENPQFDYITDSYMTFEPGQRIQVVDINGDSAPDLIAGYSNYLSYTENIGSPTEPSFLYETDIFQGISRSSILPCFVDIDADGDYDLLAGEGVFFVPPTIALYINEGTPTQPMFQLENESFITNNNFFTVANPGVADIDADGDYDLFVSEGDGGFYYYRNDGTIYQPNFTYVTDDWQNITFSGPQGWRAFSFGDIDEDGDLDLLIANDWFVDYDNIRFYRNDGTPQEADMVLETNVFLPGLELQGAYPYLVNIDCDHDLDLLVGDIDSGVYFFRNHGPVSAELPITISPSSFALHPNYPNPFNASTTIPFTLDQNLPVKIVVYNQLGQVIETLLDKQLSAGNHQINWDVGGVSSGVYLIRLDTQAGYSESRKVMLVK